MTSRRTSFPDYTYLCCYFILIRSLGKTLPFHQYKLQDLTGYNKVNRTLDFDWLRHTFSMKQDAGSVFVLQGCLRVALVRLSPHHSISITQRQLNGSFHDSNNVLILWFSTRESVVCLN